MNPRLGIQIALPRLLAVAGLLLLPATVLTQAPASAEAPATQDKTLPAARDLVAKHVAAAGGEAAQKAVKSVRMRGTFSIGAQGLTGDFEAMSARPNRTVTRVSIAAIGNIETGYDGKVGWKIDPQSGPTILDGRELRELKDEASFDAMLHGPDLVREMTTVGREEFDKRQAYKVKVSFVSGREEHQYFDAQTGLQIGSEGPKAMPLGELPVVTVIREYKKFGKLMQPATIVQRTMGIEQLIHIESCEYDTVPASAFELPPAIKALVK